MKLLFGRVIVPEQAILAVVFAKRGTTLYAGFAWWLYACTCIALDFFRGS